jgi:hypothetical protein
MRKLLPRAGGSSGMARIPDELTYGIAFTYRTRAEAENNARHGGVAFLVGKPVAGVAAPPEGFYFNYAVTNYHVPWDSNAPVLRFHRRDGAIEIVELTKGDWVPHPDGDDLAIAFLSDRMSSTSPDNVKFIPTSSIITPEIIKSHNVGFGDDVFMIGRFLNHQGTKDAIAPAVRQGNISMMPQPLWNSVTNNDSPSFAVEMRSRTGFSGSPVAVHRNALTSTFATKTDPGVPPFWWYLLGVNWGYVNEKDTKENTWLNGVVPAWKILELLEEPALKDKHDEATGTFQKWQRGEGTTTTAAVSPEPVAPPATDANPNHLKDFTRLVDVAARKRQPSGQT